MDFEALTRLLIAGGYAAAAASMFAPPQPFKAGKAFRNVWAIALLAWAVWYTVLAFFHPDPFRWGILNRTLHLPLIAGFVVQNLAARRFYKLNPQFLKAWGGDTDGD